MVSSPQYCPECGARLDPGIRFCEDCGYLVEENVSDTRVATKIPGTDITASLKKRTPGDIPSPGTQVPGVLEPERVKGVIPFAAASSEGKKTGQCTLVVTDHHVILAFWNAEIKKMMEASRKEISSAIENFVHEDESPLVSIGKVAYFLLLIPASYRFGRPMPNVLPVEEGQTNVDQVVTYFKDNPGPWTRYSSMSPDMISAEDTRNFSIPGREIRFVRCEPSMESYETQDLLLIGTTQGTYTFSVDTGFGRAGRIFLDDLIESEYQIDSGFGPKEKVIGILPSLYERHFSGFDLSSSYYFNIVVTSERVLFAAILAEDADDAYNAPVEQFYMMIRSSDPARRVQATSQEISGAPWECYRSLSPGEILGMDPVNFFIPLAAIDSIHTERKKKKDLLFLQCGGILFTLEIDQDGGAVAEALIRHAMSQ